eukprot:6455819-Amphidinium_carterae.3
MRPVRASHSQREQHDKLLVFQGTEEVGFIKYNPSLANFFAVCPRHSGCTKTKTAAVGRSAGSGAPLGFLAAWCRDAPQHGSKESHMKESQPGFAERRAARDQLKLQWNYGSFRELEQRTADAGSSEPEVVPVQNRR